MNDAEIEKAFRDGTLQEAARVPGLLHKYHASQNPGASKRDRHCPCRVCGWAQHMAIHDAGSRHVVGYGHKYQP